MKFTINNLGIVQSAEIKIDGLTVITGLNDTGKSFLSKGVFSVIKTNKEASRETRDAKYKQLQNLFSTIQQMEIQSYQGMSADILRQIEPQVNPNALFNLLNKGWVAPPGQENMEEIKDSLDKYATRIKNSLNRSVYAPIVAGREANIKNLDTHIQSIITSFSTRVEKPDKDYAVFYNSVIIPQLFKKQINNIGAKTAPATIKASMDNGGEVAVSISNNICNKFNGSIHEAFNDAVYIESPTALQLLPFITNALAFGPNLVSASAQRIGGLPYHLYDLVSKIANNVNNTPNPEFIEHIARVRETIGGRLYYDAASRTIIYDKGNAMNIQDVNIASGIKGFGILDVLFSENILNSKTLLIIDEPEVHQHPYWEIKYAKTIVSLVEANIPVLISTHSPYLLEAIYKYSNKSKIKEKTNYYYGEASADGTTTFGDVTENLQQVWEKLAEPMKELENV